jgi:hypothetical protein
MLGDPERCQDAPTKGENNRKDNSKNNSHYNSKVSVGTTIGQ